MALGGTGERKSREDILVDDRGQRTYLKYSPAYAAVRRDKDAEGDTGAEKTRDASVGKRERAEGAEKDMSGRYAELLEAFQDRVTR